MKNRTCLIMMVAIMATLLFVAPQVSTALRPKYLYFIFNILIVALVAEAGLLPFLSTPFAHFSEEDHIISTATIASNSNVSIAADDGGYSKSMVDKFSPKKIKKSLVVVKVLVEKIVEICPIVVLPIPTLFFIGDNATTTVEDSSNGDLHHDEEHKANKLQRDQQLQEEEAVEERRSGLELFTQAEIFIGNFYKQLKMQRDSVSKAEHTYS
ncbi:hypothetical protein LINGRAHAP2_LOCUS21140 [Linum grandiflorum]